MNKGKYISKIFIVIPKLFIVIFLYYHPETLNCHSRWCGDLVLFVAWKGYSHLKAILLKRQQPDSRLRGNDNIRYVNDT